MFVVSGAPGSSLDWSAELAEAKQAEAPFFWRFDFGLENPIRPFEDALQLRSMTLAADHFTKEIYPHIEKQLLGIILYEGDGAYAPLFPWTEVQKEYFVEWRRDRPRMSEELARQLFSINALSEYLHNIVPYLPETAPCFAHFDTSSLSPLAAAYSFNRARFPYVTVTTPNEAPTAIALPSDELLSPKLEETLALLIQKPYRQIPEKLLIEDWEGVDTIIAPCELTPLGERMLRGFEATGGTVRRNDEL